MPDYEEALASDSNKSKYIGKISNGEKVMAVCRIIKDSNGDNVGAIRVLSSLEQIDRQVATLTLLVLHLSYFLTFSLSVLLFFRFRKLRKLQKKYLRAIIQFVLRKNMMMKSVIFVTL